jgi:beta-glucosidase
MNPYNVVNMSVVQSAEHRMLATEAAMKTFVLMKNDGLLPLTKKYNKLAIVGPLADDKNQIFGDYGSDMVGQFTTSVHEGLMTLATTVSVGQGCTDIKCATYHWADIRGAVTGADLVVVTLGTGPDVESEGNDRADIDLPGNQLQLLQDAVYYANGAPVIVLLFNAGPLDITWAKLNPQVAAILECFFPGQTTGEAIYGTLTASAGPSSVPAGRLPATWPSHLGQVPPITNYNMTGHTYRYYMGDPLYPFGYGLSYTSFLYTSLTLSPTSLPAGKPITASVGVLNTGKFDADEVVQVYIEWTNATIPVPKLQLSAYYRVFLKAGEHRVLDLVVGAERLSVWQESVGWTYVKGMTTIYAGGQQPNQRTMAGSNTLKASFNIV